MRRAWVVFALVAAGGLTWWLLHDGNGHPAVSVDTDVLDAEEQGPVLTGTADRAASAFESAMDEGAGTIRGTVEDTAGTRLADIEVVLIRQPPLAFLEEGTTAWLRRGAGEYAKPPEVVARATTDVHGRFAFRGVDAARGDLYVQSRAAAPWFGVTVGVYPPDRHHVLRLVLGRGSPVRLRLVDPDGNGIAGFVWGFRQREGDDFVPCTFRRVPTDEQGEVTVHLPDGAFLCTVRVPGLGSREGVLVETPQSRVVEIPLGERGGATIEGVVRDDAGAAVEGALVVMRSGERPYGMATRTQRTDAEGRFRVASGVTGVLESVAVLADGYVTVPNAVEERELLPGTTTRLDIRLLRGGTIDGRVTGPDGRGVPGALVQAEVRHAGDRLESRPRTTTDADGRYVLAHVAPGEGTVAVSAPGLYQPASVNGWYVLEPASGKTTVDIRMASGTAVAGRVVDEGGNPVAGARVAVRPWGAVEGWWRETPASRGHGVDAEGRFTFHGLPPAAQWRLTAWTETMIAEPVMVDTRPEADPTSQLEIVLRRGGVIAGRVDGLDTDTASRYRIHLATDQGQNVTLPLLADGAFRVTGLVPGSWRVRAINWGGRAVTVTRVIELAWGKVVDDVVLERTPSGPISGIVVDTGGEPVPALQLSLDISTPSHGQSMQASTNARGRFTIPDVPDSGYAYSFLIGGKRMPGSVKPGDEDVRLVYARPERVRIEGRVLLPDGSPAPSGQVMIMQTTPARDGSFGSRNGVAIAIVGGAFGQTFERRSPESTFTAEVREVFTAAGRIISTLPTGEQRAEPGRPLEIRLRAGLELAGVVVDADGKPVGGVGVTLVQPASSSPTHNKHMDTRPDGSFQFSSLGPGTHELRLGRVPPPWVAPQGSGAEAGNENVRIVLVRGASVHGTVHDDAGAPVAGAQVQWQATGHGAIRARTDDDGRFELAALPPGVEGGVVVRPARSKGAPLLTTSIPGVRGGASDLDIRLKRGAMLRGTLVIEGGEHPGFMQVYAHAVGSSVPVSEWSRSTDAGTFEIGPIPPGRYRLEVQVAPPFVAPDPREVTAPADDLRIVVPRGLEITGTLKGTDTPRRYAVSFTSATPNGPAGIGGGVTAAGEFRVTLKEDTAGFLYVRDTQFGDLYGLVADVRPGGPPLEVTLQKGLVIEGRFSSFSGEGNAYVYAHTPSGLYVHAQVAKDGTFTFRGVPPGSYELHGSADGRTYGPVSVEAGRTDIVLGRP